MRTSRGIEIPEDALQWSFARSAGAGGQHVNKTSSKATLVVETSSLVGSTVKLQRIAEKLGATITLSCQESRSQWRNRQLCVERLAAMIDEAAAPPPAPRRPTKPTRGSQERRLSGKKRDADKKAGRRGDNW